MRLLKNRHHPSARFRAGASACLHHVRRTASLRDDWPAAVTVDLLLGAVTGDRRRDRTLWWHPVPMPHRNIRTAGFDRWVPRSGIRERAADVNRLHSDLHRTYAARDGSQKTIDAWMAAIGAFENAKDAFYRPFNGLSRRIREGDASALEESVMLLEADPWCFRSGYLKAEVMKALANVPLPEDARARLRRVVVHRLNHREPRLLRPASQVAAAVWDESLAETVDAILRTGTASQREDAAALLSAVAQKRRTIAGQRQSAP